MAGGALAVLVIVSSTYGNFVSDPMPVKQCDAEMHSMGRQYDAFARMREKSIPKDLKQDEYLRRIDEIWNFRIHCEPLRRDVNVIR